MEERLLISVNWVVGTVALLAGLAWPFVNVQMVIPAMRAEAEGTIRALVNAERQLPDLQRPLALFMESALPPELSQKISLPRDRHYEYEAFVNEKGALVLRAYTKPPEVLNGRLIPGVYELTMDAADGHWLGLSGSKRSLF
ncbi:hypothetical protein CCP3SC15_200015 [Gammaproteobacteria bacterium]